VESAPFSSVTQFPQIQFIIQTPTVDEWERFRGYAARVVDLHIGVPNLFSPQVNISPETMSFLEMMSTSVPLFPKLTSLRLMAATRWDVVRSTLAFLSPRITDLALTLPGEYSILLQPILSNISGRCHGVQRLELDVTVSDSRSAHEVRGLISAFRRTLETLVIKSPLQMEYLPAIASLPQLRVLKLEHAYFVDEIPPNSLPSLEAVCFLQFHGIRLRQFFERLRNPGLKKVDVSSISVIEFEDLMEVLARFSTSLSSLSTSAITDLNLPSIVVPNLFTNLRHLNVGCSSGRRHRCPFRITDQAVANLGAAMPNLSDLTLGSAACGGFHAVTFKSLSSLSTTCQGLESLSVQVDLFIMVQLCLALEGTIDTGIMSDDTQDNRCRLRKLVVGRSTLPDHADSGLVIAVGLGKIFPFLSEIVGHTGWDEVERYITISRRALSATRILGRQ